MPRGKGDSSPLSSPVGRLARSLSVPRGSCDGLHDVPLSDSFRVAVRAAPSPPEDPPQTEAPCREEAHHHQNPAGAPNAPTKAVGSADRR